MLTKLGYIEESTGGKHAVELKGRVTCEISQTEMELVLVELIFDGTLVRELSLLLPDSPCRVH